ncbi:MAG: rubrerythrin family protein [Cyanobacteria bacterium]|nr:rubrerythrin family protein [Cyanobacteriota bacterium]
MNHHPTTETARNLESAFAGESMANRKYLYFAKIARELGNPEIAELFENTAHQETSHAFAHLELIYGKADSLTVERLLEIAIEGELYETNQMYPSFEKTAREEGHLDAVAEFQEQALESKEHASVFAKAAKRFKALTLVEAQHAARYQKALEGLTVSGVS